MECYSAMKRNDSDTCNTLDGPQDNYAKYKKLVVPCGLEGKESGCNAGDSGSVPGLGRSPGEGNGYQLQYSCLENSMDRGAWWLQSMGPLNNNNNQWLRIHLLMQGMWVQSLVGELRAHVLWGN